MHAKRYGKADNERTVEEFRIGLGCLWKIRPQFVGIRDAVQQIIDDMLELSVWRRTVEG